MSSTPYRSLVPITPNPITSSDVSGLLAGNVQPLMNKIARNIEDAVILVLGDSTGNDQNEWVYLMSVALGTTFPSYSVYYSLWDGSAWPVATKLTNGSGARTLTIYNGSVAGARTTYSFAGRWATMIQGVTPDLIIINYGHNQGTFSYCWTPDYLNLTEALTDQHPQAGMVLILQNPAQANNNQQLRMTQYEAISRMRGYGVVNVMQSFLDYGPSWYPDLMADTIHPNTTGQTYYWLPRVMAMFSYNSSYPMRPSVPSSLASKGFQLLKNGDFSSFVDGSIPANWTQITGTATYVKDSTNYESANGYSMILTATGGAASAISQDLPINQVKGRWITALVRMRIEVGATDQTGVVALYDNVNGSYKDNDGGRGALGGAFRWVVVSKLVPANATTARLYLYADTSTTNAACRIDSASVVLGRLPMV